MINNSIITGLKNNLAGWIQPKPVIDQHTEAWLLETFLWAYSEFDGEFFQTYTQFILPTKAFFPQQVSSIEQMAGYVFKQVINFAGMQAWPLEIVAPHQVKAQSFPMMQFAGVKRGDNAELMSTSGLLQLSYNPNQINQPQDLVASFAQSLGYVKLLQSQSEPPGGKEFAPQAVDLVACFLGFGVMMANTAYQFKGGCGSCYNPYANRSSSLSESELVYILALLLKVKKLPLSTVSPHLKPHLKGLLKKANKQLANTLNQSANPILMALTEAK